MEGGGTWSLDLSASSLSYVNHFKDLSLHLGEGDVEDDLELEYPCPFCSDDYYDLVDLCGHIDDEHPEEADFGVCPVCETRVGVNMVDHITMQHGSIFKSHYKLKLHKQLSSIRKDSKDEYMQSILASRSSTVPISSTVPDQLLSFICNMPSEEESKTDQPGSSSEVSILVEESSENNMLKRAPLSEKDREETTSRCDFVQGLMCSLLLGDDL